MNSLQVVTTKDLESREIREAFPELTDEQIGFEPYGGRVLVQTRRTSKKVGRFIMPDEVRDGQKWNESVSRILRIGPLAFRQKDTMSPWPEGIWAKVGDYVRCPRYGGDRWDVDLGDGEGKVTLAVFNDHELIGRIIGSPLVMRSYV